MVRTFAGIQLEAECIRFCKWILHPGSCSFVIRNQVVYLPGPFPGGRTMVNSDSSRATILFVDDDPAMREVMGLILGEEGFDVVTAANGIEALVELRRMTPDLIISDLHMPAMSGVEFLSVVRRRFPAIPAIATSGAYDLSQSYAAGVMADAFYPKGQSLPDELIQTIRDLMYKPLKRPTNYHPCQPPRVQSARPGFDGHGVPVLLLTCTDCLRSFSVANVSGCDDGTLHAHCPSCRALVQFTCDAADAPVTEVVPAMQTRVELGRVA